MSEDKIINDNGNQIKVKDRYREQSMSFTDEKGNRFKFDLQSQQWCNTETGLDGYTVYPVNLDPDVGPYDDGYGVRRKAAYDKIYRDAEKYFDEHPDERPDDGYSRRNTYLQAYSNIQATKEIKRRVENGQASSLEKVYAHLKDNLKREIPYCWEQIEGEMPVDAPLDVVQEAIKNDDINVTLKKQAEEFRRSAERGTESIKNRVAEAQNMRFELRSGNREVPHAEEALRKKQTQNRDLSRDEVNALIKHKVDKLNERR